MNQTEIRPDRLTVKQLLAAARRDSDRVSVFFNGSNEADTEGAIFVIKDTLVATYLAALLQRQRLLTPGKDVERPIDVDVSNPATCTGCACTDRRACAGGCYWLAVDRAEKTGVCSNCRPALTAWRNQRGT